MARADNPPAGAILHLWLKDKPRSRPKLEILATNKIEDKTDASLALAGNELFLRGRANLYCIGNK